MIFESLKLFIYNINESKILAAISMLLLNIGSKYIELKISDTQAEYIRNEIGREILIFSMVFIGTKDIILSIIVTAAFIILANTVFHEESNYCMMPEKYKKQNVNLNKNENIIMTTQQQLEKVRENIIENMTGESLIFTNKNIEY
jgi:hypothetical protein